MHLGQEPRNLGHSLMRISKDPESLSAHRYRGTAASAWTEKQGTQWKNCLWFPEKHMLVSLIFVYWYKALYICLYSSKSIPWGLDLTYYWFVSHFHYILFSHDKCLKLGKSKEMCGCLFVHPHNFDNHPRYPPQKKAEFKAHPQLLIKICIPGIYKKSLETILVWKVPPSKSFNIEPVLVLDGSRQES